jgi:hypothetical protein
MKGTQNCSSPYNTKSSLKGDNTHKSAKIGWSHLNNLFSRITGPEKLIFTRKLSDIV